jgi:predicted phosphodiesterase
LFLVIAFFVFEAYTVIIQREGDAPLPPLFGNFPRIRAVLESQPKKDEFVFAVVGDTKSVGTFEKICEELRRTPLDFMVLLGDCSYEGTEREHRYFRAECAKEFALPCPVFYVVGNHDVSPTTFPISRFEEVYGPSIFSFAYQECLFLVLRILDEPFSNEESLSFLRGYLDKQADKYRLRFVFMHVPPPVSDTFTARKYAAGEELVEVLSALNVDYVFAGDFHGYARTKLGKTNYIVTGGGGAHLNEKKSRQFHHAMIIRIGKDHVSEQIVPVTARNDLEDTLERVAIAEVYPWLSSHRLGAVAANIGMLAVLLVCLWLWRLLLKRTR